MNNQTAKSHAEEILACLIIDDPILKPRYGCLEYTDLLQEMKVHNFFTEIAFIPWNYKRSESKTIKLFLENPDYFGICVHGCDHTGKEFGGNDYEWLCEISFKALWRMEEHKKLTGLSYDPVMVFPQGHFSSVAMKALKNSNYSAAFNSSLKATDGEDLPEIEYRKPATTAYHNFPLFLRRYSSDKSGILQDINSGRPVIIVEHHGAFRNGYGAIAEAIDWINSLGSISWRSLGSIAKHYGVHRITATRPNHVQSRTRLLFSGKAALRRYLSEIRDNYFEPSESLDKIYRTIMSMMRRR
jgi:hypothetical protein